MPSYFDVAESTQSRSLNNSGVRRVYIARWVRDPAEDPEIHPTEKLARDAVREHIEAQTEENSPSAIPIGFELYGFPRNDIEPEEVPDSNGEAWIVSVSWGNPAGADGPRAVAGAGAVNKATANDPEASATVTYSVSAEALGGYRDAAPVRCLFALDASGEDPPRPLFTGGPLISLNDPPFAWGSLNPEMDSDGVVAVRGLDYAPPPANVSYRLEFSRGSLNAAYVKDLMTAARDGALNSEQVSIAGVTYNPLELCFVGVSVGYTSGAATYLDLAFSYAPRVAITIFGGTADVTQFTGNGGSYKPFLTPITQPADGTLYVSGHDYVGRFRNVRVVNTPDAETPPVWKATIDYIIAYAIWPTKSYNTLLGATSL